MLTLTMATKPLRDTDPVHVESVEIAIPDASRFVRSLDSEDHAALIRALAETLPASDFVEAMEEGAADELGAQPLSAAGDALLDEMVKRAGTMKRLPDDYEPDWVADFRASAARLQIFIAAGDTDAALDLLADMAPDSELLSTAAARMVAGFEGKVLL